MKHKTTVVTPEVEKQWYIIDAKDQILGRLAVKIANLLRGRGKPTYTPHLDRGDFVIVINADKIKLTGKKMQDKQYMFYTGWFGNERYVSVEDMIKKKPEYPVRRAVEGMFPRNRLADQMLKKLKIFAGSEHPHAAQSPIVFEG